MRQRKNLSRGGMTLREEIKQKKGVATLYMVLRILVILVMVAQFLNGNFENVFLCILTLILFLVPTFIERKIRIDLPDTLEVIILLFIFAAEILGEIQAYYITFPYWDTMLHTLTGSSAPPSASPWWISSTEANDSPSRCPRCSWPWWRSASP